MREQQINCFLSFLASLSSLLTRISEKSSNESASTPSDTATPGGAPYDNSEHEQVQEARVKSNTGL